MSIVYGRDGAVAILTLNRPERRNALSTGLMTELLEALEQVAGDQDVRSVILASRGTVFSSGHDLNELKARSDQAYRDLFALCTRLMLGLHSLPQPVIAQVQGLATAAGCQLVAGCDLAVAGESAAFATPGCRIGLFCTTPMVPLARTIGRKRALEMLLTGHAVDARTAAEWGLVNRVVPDDRLVSTTLELAHRIAEASAYTIGLGKQAFYRQSGMDEESAYRDALETMVCNAAAPDAQEGISAFLEKRPACWGHRPQAIARPPE